MKGIISDDLDVVISRLKNDDFDDTEFASEKYDSMDSTVDIGGEEIPLIQGEVTLPRSQFTVSYKELRAADFTFDPEPPGILPYAATSYQIGLNPSQRDTAFLSFSNDHQNRIGIRWLFDYDEENTLFSPWKRLEEDYVNSLPEFKKPDKDPIQEIREGKSIYGGQTHPEDVNVVRDRIDEYWWEVWNARCQELMNTWRVLVPFGSVDPRPMVFGPANTIVSNNYNFAICPDGETAVAIAAVLGTNKVKEDILSISPWVKGKTPRPSVKHISVLLNREKDIMESLIDKRSNQLGDLASSFEQFHQDVINILNQYVQIDHHSGNRLRGYHVGTSNTELMDSEIEGIHQDSSDANVKIETEDGNVDIEFHDKEYASSMAIGSWLGAGFKHTVDEVLDLPAAKTDFPTTRDVLYEREFSEFCRLVEEEHY